MDDSFSGDTGSLGDKLSGTSVVSDAVERQRTSHSRIVIDQDVALLKINVRVMIIFVFHPFITF